MVCAQGWKYFAALSVFLHMQVALCMPENYYNPDYGDEDRRALENWGQFDTESDSVEKLVPPSALDKRHMGSVAAYSGQREPSMMPNPEIHNLPFQSFRRVSKSTDSKTNFEGFHERPVDVKQKRFLGPLARGGWFPREFRGFVSQPQYAKRHVGSAMRQGYAIHKLATEDAMNPMESIKRDLIYENVRAKPVHPMLWGGITRARPLM